MGLWVCCIYLMQTIGSFSGTPWQPRYHLLIINLNHQPRIRWDHYQLLSPINCPSIWCLSGTFTSTLSETIQHHPGPCPLVISLSLCRWEIFNLLFVYFEFLPACYIFVLMQLKNISPSLSLLNYLNFWIFIHLFSFWTHASGKYFILALAWD